MDKIVCEDCGGIDKSYVKRLVGYACEDCELPQVEDCLWCGDFATNEENGALFCNECAQKKIGEAHG